MLPATGLHLGDPICEDSRQDGMDGGHYESLSRETASGQPAAAARADLPSWPCHLLSLRSPGTLLLPVSGPACGDHLGTTRHAPSRTTRMWQHIRHALGADAELRKRVLQRPEGQGVRQPPPYSM